MSKIAVMDGSLVLFTDLDGTLLDASSYSWEPALPALDLIRSRSIPLILCSSKTRAEIEVIRRAIQNEDPFISENGGGIFIPEGYFPFDFSYTRVCPGYRVIDLGTGYSRLREALTSISKETGVVLRGFGDLSAGEISRETGLSNEEAHRAKEREYDEPFILPGTDLDRDRVLKRVAEKSLRWTRGGRFYHLTGENDKGKAVRLLARIFEKKLGKIYTVALGDDMNDLPMLEAVEYPVIVQKPGGSYEVPHAQFAVHRAEGIGPEGWKNAVLQLLDEDSR